MPLDRKTLLDYTHQQRFKDAFRELGWGLPTTDEQVEVGGGTYVLEAIASLKSVHVYHCKLDAPSRRSLRRDIGARLARTKPAHLLIFTEPDGQQWWQLASPRRTGAAQYAQLLFHPAQSGEALWRALRRQFMTHDDYDDLGLADVLDRLDAEWNKAPVTKAFFSGFRAARDRFLQFVKNLPDDGDRHYYVSVLINRLMFIYFIQRRGFLAGDHDYLRSHLRKRTDDGEYYRDFLQPLFFEGFAQPAARRSKETKALLGDIPYLNGGIFQKHPLERANPGLAIPDDAFDELFDFFEKYRWELDDRVAGQDTTINPDVLGYVFEQYINQKEMGAYYTQEDITGYISASTILPYLLETVGQACRAAFAPEGEVWRRLTDEPDTYIPAALRHGVREALPDYIAAGLDAVSARGRWNEAAPASHGLPTEIWREVVARRARYAEVRGKLVGGEVRAVNDLVTLNLDLPQFALDVLAQTEDPGLVRAFWKALNEVTVLDPTCGSGAFLFAALKLLLPLYETALDRMRHLVAARAETQAHEGRYKELRDFDEVLAEVARHPNERYFIHKSIVVQNLYGVDLMEEATEICKLRLFLQLVAQVDDVAKVEPLPDIDFNIRAGNALVGFATFEEFEQSVARHGGALGMMTAAETATVEDVRDRADRAASQFRLFREMQTQRGVAPSQYTHAKTELRTRLRDLSRHLDRFLALAYGVTPEDPAALDAWRASHEPFHWFANFYATMAKGGFDVIVGNPPYVDYPIKADDEADTYSVRGYTTTDCKDLYALTIERSLALTRPDSQMGMIVPLSLTFSRDFTSLRHLLRRSGRLLVHSSYDNVPDRAFRGAKESDNTSKNNQQRVTIFLLDRNQGPQEVYSAPLLRWRTDQRSVLFDQLPLCCATDLTTDDSFPKLGDKRLAEFMARWEAAPRRLSALFLRTAGHQLVVPKTAGYYIAAYPDAMKRSQQMTLWFGSEADRDIAAVLINSNAFFWYWRVLGDAFHVTQGNVGRIPLFQPQDDEYRLIARQLEEAREACTVYKGYRGKQVPNINFNLRMDVLFKADEWIIRHVAPDLGVTPYDFLWAKSNSFLSLDVPNADNYPDGWPDL